MITCPNCHKQNADEAAHCGFCGHQLDAGGKKPLKTMFGMNALDPELLKQSIGEAKAAQDAPPAAPPAPEATIPMPTSIPKLNLPKPAEDPFGATEAMPAVTAPNPAVGGAPKHDPFMDEFAALEAQFGHEFAPSKPPPSEEEDPNAPTEMHDTSALLAEMDQKERPASMPTPMFDMGSKPAGAKPAADPFAAPSNDPFAAPSNDPFAAIQRGQQSGPPSGDPFGPPKNNPFGPPAGPPPGGDPFAPPKNDPFGPPKGGNNLPAPMPGGGQVAKKDNTKLFIIGGVAVFGFVMMAVCLVSAFFAIF